MAKVQAKPILSLDENDKSIFIVKRKWWFLWLTVKVTFKTRAEAEDYIKFKGWVNTSSVND